MTATTMTPSPTQLAAARARNEAVWRTSSALLYAGRIDEFIACWHDEARYEVAYPVGSFPALVEGRAALAQLFKGFGAATERIDVHDVRFYQTDDPEVAFVEERMVAELVGGGRYENKLAIRVTFRDGLLAQMFEYYGQRAHEELLRRLGLTA